MKKLLEAIQYSTYQWNICGDLKVIGMLMGMQGGFTKYCSFLCLWDSRATGDQYIKREWQKRTTYEPGMNGVQNVLLVDPKKIFLPPLHIKLSFMKNFVKAMYKTNSRGYQYLVVKFPKISAAKLKEGIFVVPQIRQVLKDGSFDESLSECQLRARHSFKWIYGHFLGNNKSPTYRDGIQNLLDTYHKIGLSYVPKNSFFTFSS